MFIKKSKWGKKKRITEELSVETGQSKKSGVKNFKC